MYSFDTKLRVRYGETDKMGYVYYGTYALYYETGRTEMLRSLGLTYRELEDAGIMLPVQTFSLKYIKPAFYDDLLTIRTYIKELPGVRLKFEYETYNEKGELLNSAETLLVFIDEKTRRPRKAPEILMKTLAPFFTK